MIINKENAENMAGELIENLSAKEKNNLYNFLRAKLMQGTEESKKFIEEYFKIEFEELIENEAYYIFVIHFWNTLLYIKENNLNDILSLQEASEMWGLDDSTLRKAIANSKFIENKEYRKTGRNYIIKKSAMIRAYGEPN